MLRKATTIPPSEARATCGNVVASLEMIPDPQERRAAIARLVCESENGGDQQAVKNATQNRQQWKKYLAKADAVILNSGTNPALFNTERKER